MPINFDPNSLNSVFDKNFGAGAYNAGLSNAAKAAQLKQQVAFAKTNYLKRLSAAQAKAKQDQQYMDKYGMTKDQYDAQQAQKKQNSTFNSAMNYWSDKKGDLQKNGAYKTANDLLNNPQAIEGLKNQGYDVNKIVDAAYQVASNGKFASKKAYDQYATALDKSNTDKKANMDSIDLYLQKAKAEEQQKNAPKQQSFADKAKTFTLGALDLIDRPGNAVRTGIKDAISGKNFLQGAKEGLLGKDHTSGVQLLQKAGLDPNNNAIAKSLLNGVATGLQINPTGNALFGMVGTDNNRGQRTAGLATEIALDPLSYLGARVPKVKPGVTAAEDALRLGAPPERLGLPAPTERLGISGSPSPLSLPEPQLRLNAPVKEPLGLPVPQLQLEAPKPIQNSLDTLLNAAKQPNGLQSPIPQIPSKMKNIMLQNDMKNALVGFAQNTKNLPKARFSTTPIERASSLDPLHRSQTYWKTRYYDFAQQVQANHHTNDLSQEKLQALWQQFAKANEPKNLHDVVDLAYGNGTAGLKNTPFNAEQRMNDILNGVKTDNSVGNSILAPVEQGPRISRPATLDEMVQHLQDITSPKQAVQEPLPLNFKRQVVAKANRGQEPPLQFKKTIPNPALQVKKDVSNSPLFLNPSSLKPENILKTTSTAKTLDKMTKDELQTVYKQLQDKKSSLSSMKTKASKKQIKAIEDDLKKVNDFLMKSNLQIFGQGAKKKPTTREPITPREKKAQKKAVADFTDKAKKAGIPSEIRKEVKQIDNVGKTLKGAKNINQMADKLPKETGDKIKAALTTAEDLKKVKDIKSFQTGTLNQYELADRLPKQMGDNLKNNLDTVKKNYVADLEKSTNLIHDKITKDLKIIKGSQESALVQDYGEKTLAKKYLRKRGIDPNKLSKQELQNVNDQQLKKLRPNDWENIKKADEILRDFYNKRIDKINEVRAQIYPNQPDKLVPKRDDYYHHFNELTGMEGVKNLFDTPANIDPHLEGISPFTRPNSKFQGFMQKRMNGAYKSDAIGGVLKYIKASAHSINVDPMIKILRQTTNQIADATTETRNANKIKEALVDHTNDLAGKTNPWDRLLQKGVGRKGERILSWANSRVKSNMVLANMGSALGQLGNVPLGIAKAKQYSVPGLKDSLSQFANWAAKGQKDAPIYKSTFLKERYSDGLFRRFDQRLIDQPKKMATWMLETADKAGTNFVWNSMHNKALKEKIADPIKFADYETRKIVAGRGIGEVPMLQKSKTMQILAPFTLEVGNQWKVLRKIVGEKDAAGIVTFLVASYALNQVVSHVRGSSMSFDPIGALVEGYNQADGNTGQKGLGALKSLTGEVVGNIPGGNIVTGLSNTDKNIPLTNTKFKEIFGTRDPNRFGTGLTMAKAFQDPLFALLPFGASQVRKTTQGIDTLMNGGAYQGDNGLIPFAGSKEKLMYPLQQDGVMNTLDKAKLPIFGPSSSGAANDYYKNNRSPLSAKQTQAYQNSPNPQNYYNNLMNQRDAKAIQKKIKDIQNDNSLTLQQKNAQILQLMSQLQKLAK